MHQVETLALLLAAVGIVGVLAERFKAPLPMLLIFAGVLLSLIPNGPQIELDPELIFFVILPPLLYIEAYQTPWRKLKDVGDLVSAQAIGLVIVTIFGVAAALKMVIPGMPWAIALTFGAIVSPTDAVSVSAVTRGATIPAKTMDIIRGESLVNDATGLVGYQAAVAAAVTGVFSVWNAGGSLLYVGLGGVGLGLILGLFLRRIRTEVSHRPSEIIASFLSPFVVYLAAEHFKVSGIIAVVSAGLLLGAHGPRMLSSSARVQARANWDSIAYILNGFTFLLIGLEVKPVALKVLKYPLDQLVVSAIVVIATSLVLRLVWTYVTYQSRRLIGQPVPSWKRVIIFSWCGMRGVVSLAAALSLPLTISGGEPFPYRNLLIFLTIVVIAFSLFVQGGTLPFVLRMLNLAPEEMNAEETERMVRLKLTKEAIRALDEAATREGMDRTDPTFQRVVNTYVHVATLNMVARDETENEMVTKLETIAVDSQRRVLLNMRDSNEIDEHLFQQLQNELDLADMHIRAIVLQSD